MFTLMVASYLDSVMRIHQQHLLESLHHSQNMLYVYALPMWKQQYKQCMTHSRILLDESEEIIWIIMWDT